MAKDTVLIQGFDYTSGEPKAVSVDASGQIEIAVTVADVVRARISGDTVISKISGDTVIAKISGESITAVANVSGQPVKISGETVDLQVPTSIKTGALLHPTAASGGTIVTSGAVKSASFKSLSGDVYLGGTGAGNMPYSGYGFLISAGEAYSADIDNFGRARICAPVNSGDLVSYVGVS